MTLYTRLFSLFSGSLIVLFLLAACGDDSSDSTDENEPGSFVLSDDNYSVLENAGALTLTVNRIDGSSGAVTVDYTTQDETATNGADYQTSTSTLSFADGEISQTISVVVIDNSDTDGDKTFSVNLSNATGGATLGVPSDATVTILDDEGIAIYDFENLLEGNINGQDNWVESVTNATIVNDILVNGTQVVRPNVITGLAGDTELTRLNDASFNFAPFTDSGGEIWFDATGDDNAIFSLGQDSNNDGVLDVDDKEIGVPFGIWERQFAILTANSLTVRAGVADLGVNDEATDWYRLRLQVDFDANAGEGTASLSYMNLSNGETSFSDIPTLQDVNLRLLQNGAPNQADWNAMFLKLRVDATNIPKVDNLIPNIPTSP